MKGAESYLDSPNCGNRNPGGLVPGAQFKHAAGSDRKRCGRSGLCVLVGGEIPDQNQRLPSGGPRGIGPKSGDFGSFEGELLM